MYAIQLSICHIVAPVQEISAALVDHVHEYEIFRSAQNAALESVMARQFATDLQKFEDKLRAELGDVCNGAKKVIVDTILTQVCPRCRAAFLDFEGCMAVKCSQCSAAFCAVCTTDCGADAHEHVRNCKWVGAIGLFAPAQGIQTLVNGWRRHKILEVLSGIPCDLKARVIQDLSRELLDVGLNPGDLVQAA
jgi:hypothetical protein